MNRFKTIYLWMHTRILEYRLYILFYAFYFQGTLSLYLDSIEITQVFVLLNIHSIYLLDKVIGGKEDRFNQIHITKQNKKNIICLIIIECILILFIISFHFSMSQFLIFLGGNIIALLYMGIPIKQIRLKSILIVKNIIIGLCFATILTTPFIKEWNNNISYHFWILFYIFTLSSISGDIKGRVGDKKANLLTIPVLIGKFYTLLILVILSLIAVILILLTGKIYFTCKLFYLLPILILFIKSLRMLVNSR